MQVIRGMKGTIFMEAGGHLLRVPFKDLTGSSFILVPNSPINSRAIKRTFFRNYITFYFLKTPLTNVCPSSYVHCSFHFHDILDPFDGLHDFCVCLGSFSCYCDNCPCHRLHLPNLGFFHPPICLWKTRGKLSEAGLSQLVLPNN